VRLDETWLALGAGLTDVPPLWLATGAPAVVPGPGESASVGAVVGVTDGVGVGVAVAVGVGDGVAVGVGDGVAVGVGDGLTVGEGLVLGVGLLLARGLGLWLGRAGTEGEQRLLAGTLPCALPLPLPLLPVLGGVWPVVGTRVAPLLLTAGPVPVVVVVMPPPSNGPNTLDCAKVCGSECTLMIPTVTTDTAKIMTATGRSQAKHRRATAPRGVMRRRAAPRAASCRAQTVRSGPETARSGPQMARNRTERARSGAENGAETACRHRTEKACSRAEGACSRRRPGCSCSPRDCSQFRVAFRAPQ